MASSFEVFFLCSSDCALYSGVVPFPFFFSFLFLALGIEE